MQQAAPAVGRSAEVAELADGGGLLSSRSSRKMA
jgi:hypothetical protein